MDILDVDDGEGKEENCRGYSLDFEHYQYLMLFDFSLLHPDFESAK